MGKDSPNTGGMERAGAAMMGLGNSMVNYQDEYRALAKKQLDLGENMFNYGMARTEKYADPVLNEFLRIMNPAGGDPKNLGIGASSPVGGYVSPVQSALNQTPAWQTQQSTHQAKQGILRNTPPGPQQSALLAEADNQRSANLGVNAFSQVQNMLNTLLGQGNQAWMGAQFNQQAIGGAGQDIGGAVGTLSAAGQMYSGAGNIASQVSQMEQQAKQSNNAMLGGVFKTIGTLGGMVLGGPIGGAIGGMIGGGIGTQMGGGTAGSMFGSMGDMSMLAG